MKKLLSYSLLLVALIVLFNVLPKQVKADGCVLTGWDWPACHNGTGGMNNSVFTGDKNTPKGTQETCTAPDMSKGNCDSSGGKWYPDTTTPPTTKEAVSVTTSNPTGTNPTPPVGGICTGGSNTPPGCNNTINVPGSSCVIKGQLSSTTVSAATLTTFEGNCDKIGAKYNKDGMTIFSETCTLSGGSPYTCDSINWGDTSFYGTGGPQGTVAPIDLTYTLLAPLPNIGATFNPADKSALGTYLNLMIKIFIGVCAVLAVIMIVMGGIEYMTSELISSKEAGKERITNAIFGLILALGAWTLLYTINPNLLVSDINIPDVAARAVLDNEDIPQSPTNGKYGGYNAGANFASSFPQNSIAKLPSGVTINKQQCVNIGDPNCTSTLGLDPSIINSTTSNCKSSSGGACQLIITGGTEFWLHGGASGNTSHRPGSPTVDLSATSDLNNYITGSSSFPTDGRSTNKNGVCYYAEGAGATSSTTASHWHVYNGSCQ